MSVEWVPELPHMSILPGAEAPFEAIFAAFFTFAALAASSSLDFQMQPYSSDLQGVHCKREPSPSDGTVQTQ